MSESTVSLIVSLLPLLLFLGAFLYFGRRQGMQAKGPSGASILEIYEQQLAEIRRMNDKLERIASALERKGVIVTRS